MGDEQQAPRGFAGFMSTVPGILTAFAAVVTAAGGIYLGVHNAPASGGTPVPQPVSTMVINLKADGGSPPVASGSVDDGAMRLDDAKATSSSDPVERLVNQCLAGDDDACLQVLETLAQDCSDGDGPSCDDLYEISPIGSAYEDFGATCGARFPSTYADTCSER